MTAVIQSIQQVTITLSAAQASNTATISSVTTANAFLVPQGSGTTSVSATNSGQNNSFRFDLTNSTTVTLTRGTASGTISANAVIIEFSTGVNSIQQGTIAIAAGNTTNTATISAAGSNAFVLLLGASITSTGNNTNSYCPTIELTNSTTVTATIGTGPASGTLTVGYVVADLTSAIIKSVQKLAKTNATASTSYTDTITSVTAANSWIAYGGVRSTMTGANYDSFFHTIELTNGTTTTYTRTGTLSTSRTICGTVVEFQTGILNSSVQRGTLAVATSATATITSVGTTKAFCNFAGFKTTNTAGPSTVFPNLTLTNSTTVTETLNSSGNATSSYEVIEFSSATGIAFDAASNSTYQAAASSYSWSHTCTGSNRYLSVEIAMLSLAQTVTSVTYNGALLEFLGAQNSITGAARIELWGIPNPSSGTNTIAVTLSGAIASAGVASSYTGVNQSSPVESFNSAQATNVGAADATVTITTVSDNCWVIAAVATDDASITSNNTSRNNVTGAGGSGANSDNNAAKTPAGTVTMSWTGVGALATWAILGIALRPIADATLDIGWFPVYLDQSRPNFKVQRDFFFSGIPKLSLPMPWIPRYPDQVPFFNQQIPSGQAVEPIQPLNLPLPWLPSYPNQIPFFVQQNPSGQAFEPVFPLNFLLKWLPAYPNQVPFFVQPVASGQSVEPVSAVAVNTPLPWLPVYVDTYRPINQLFRSFVFEPIIPLNFPLPWIPLYSDQQRLNLPVQRDFVFSPIIPLNLPLPWLPQYTDLPRPVIQPFKNFFFVGIPPLNFPTPWLPDYPNQAPFFVQQIPAGQVAEPVQPLNFTIPWMPNYLTNPLPVPPVQDTNPGFAIQTVTQAVNIGWFPNYPTSYPGSLLSASALSGFFGPPFPIVVPPTIGLVNRIGHILSHPGIACLGFGVATDKIGSI